MEKLTINPTKSQKRKLIISIVVVSMLAMIGFLSTPQVNASYSIYMHEDDVKYAVAKDFISGNTYDINLTYDTFLGDTMDIGFSLHENNNFKKPLLTVDTAGTDFESATWVAPRAGDFYIKFWMTSGDTGSVEITVTEHGTFRDIDVDYASQSFVSQFLWLIIMLSVIGVMSIFSIVLIVVVGAKAIQKQKERVMAARASGEALPRAGRKKDKCPFCGVKLPKESLVTCPYCNAPITDE